MLISVFSLNRPPNNAFQRRPRSEFLIILSVPYAAPLNVSVRHPCTWIQAACLQNQFSKPIVMESIENTNGDER